MLRVDQGTLLSVDVGVLCVRDVATTDAERCLELETLLAPLLEEAPDVVAMERYFAHEDKQRGLALNYAVRTTIELAVRRLRIPLKLVTPNTWKSVLGASGKETDKEVLKARIEALLGTAFPDKLPIRQTPHKFRTDASDATGIGLWMAMTHAGKRKLTVAPTFALATPEPKKRRM